MNQLSTPSIINSVVWLVVIGIVFYLLYWLIDYIKLVDPFAKVARVLLALASVLIVINFLMTLTGHPFYAWPR